MHKIIRQLIALYWAIGIKKRIILLSALMVTSLFLFWLCTLSPFRPLRVDQHLSDQESKKIEELFEKNGIAYRKKGENQILVSDKQRERAEEKLGQLLHEDRYKGLELFDTNTWIKGEKELQMLEMRALKGQLERDISSFDNIQHATVILDLVPPKLFGHAKYQTKASVILTLHEEEELSLSELRAIAYHLSGAVRGLEPKMIAISDTTGKLYKAIQQEGEDPLFTNITLNIEERMEEKVKKLLTKVVGKGNFHLDLTLGEEKNFLALMIKEQTMDSSSKIALENQIKVLLSELDKEPLVVIDFVHLKKQESHSYKHPIWPYTALAFGLLSLSLLFFIGSKTKGKKREVIDIEKLADLIKDQDPKIIALMFSYLETEKAEKLLFALPYPVQKRVAMHLPGLHSEDSL